ncbi:UNVERIFIED_CONTAM: hypothetical protein FKN15_054005 [Acipenser sinensis]
MRKTELDQLADFLGHDISVHQQYYRLPEGTLQLAKISKILMAMEIGRLSEFKGMKLDDIEIDPQGKKQMKRRKWDMDEIKAVERHMMKFIRMCKVPGKTDCLQCLQSEPHALKVRLVSHKILHKK